MYTSDTFIEASIKRNNGIKGVVYIFLLIIIALLILAAIYAVPIVIGFYELLYASIPLTALVIWGLVILIQRRYVEYEIEIVNDLFTVTKIVGKKKRVDLVEFSVKDCDYIYGGCDFVITDEDIELLKSGKIINFSVNDEYGCTLSYRKGESDE